MNISTRQLNNITIITLHGSFDEETFHALEETFQHLISIERCRIVVNMHGVGVVAPAGLSILTKGKQLCQAKGGDIFLCALRPHVVVMLEIAQLHTRFAMFDSEQEAIGAFFVAPILAAAA